LKIVVKIGGAAMDNAETLHKCAQAVAELSAAGHKVAVVHGGGAALTRTLKALGKESQFIDGLRVTDAETRDVALMVLAGKVNKQLTAEINACGQPALGICGGDGLAFTARKMFPKGHDLGFVGEISNVDSRWIKALWEHGGVPVISSIAMGSDGQYYNVNADQMAAACAGGCKANALIFLTDVPGVKGADKAVIRWLPLTQVPKMIEEGVISGGMLPKLQACEQALRNGVSRVRIMPSVEASVLPGFYQHKIDLGTEVLAQ